MKSDAMDSALPAVKTRGDDHGQRHAHVQVAVRTLQVLGLKNS